MDIFNFLLIFLLPFTIAFASIDPISQSLLSLKSEFIDNSNVLNDWSIPSSNKTTTSINQISACSWSGVFCDQNSSVLIGLDISLKNLSGKLSGKQFTAFIDLVNLNLSSNSFSGQLPVTLFNLSNLETLDISRNNFSGPFPNGLSNLRKLTVLDAFSNSFAGDLPADVSELPVLQVLNFAGSYFTGPIPSEYGSFKNLNFIHLGGNFLSGSIPPELGMLTSVNHMEIGYNVYEGSIPWQLGNMSSLNYLDIAGANLSGKIPKQLSNLTNLTSLFLFRNQLDGMIPLEIFSNLVKLESLDLSDNLLSGSIPETISELKSLKLLSFMYNEMSGDIPQGIAELPQLESLLLWNNFFTGMLPENLGRFSKLRYVDVSTNNFVGGIPPDICAGGMLSKLILFSNNLTGGLSPSLSNCSTIVRLRLEDNLLSGDISSVISKLVEVTYVDLSGNKFTGGISSDIVKAVSQLEYFNVSNNPDLGGFLPENMWTLPLLQNFSASSCNLSGNIPPFELCKSLSVIELSTNKLYGNIPDSISNCSSLLRLDLSHNSLSGPIPNQLGNSPTLKVFNVSFNDISGSIPLEKTFSNMDSSGFIGNPKLCGAPLGPCRHGIEVGSRKTQKVAWVLITCTVVVLLIIISVFGVIYFKTRINGRWKMISYNGLPEFTAQDVLKSLNSRGAKEVVPTIPHSPVHKVVLPTGITLSVKKIEWEPKHMDTMLESLHVISNANHKNLIRLLGVCYNRHQAYLLYDYLDNGNLSEKITMTGDWTENSKIIIGIARGLCFLHHVCYPSIPHGDLNERNVLFDEFGDPHLAEYGLGSLLATGHTETDESEAWLKNQLQKDIQNFGKIIMGILTNGGSKDAEIGSSSDDCFQEEIANAIEVASMCTRSKPSDRPSMQEVLKILSGSKPQWTSPLHKPGAYH